MNRIRLAERIAAGDTVKHYPWRTGLSIWTNGLDERAVTSHVRKMLADDHVHLVDENDVEWKRVKLTDAGEAWLEAAKADER